MKNLFLTLIFVFILFDAHSQVPEMFTCQGVLRNSSGELVNNSEISVQISLLLESSTGTIQYSEVHVVNTNNYGQFSVKVGNGTVLSGIFSDINWLNEMYLKTEIANPAGGTLVEMGTVQLISVPYALHAKNVENNNDADADPLNEIQNLNLTGTELSISGGNTIDLSIIQDGVEDADADTTNEIQDLNLTDNILTITNKTNPTQINLAAYQGTNTDEQVLSLTGTDLSISGGNTIDLSPIQDGVDDADNNPMNEIQTLSLVGDTLEISNGNSIVFPYDSSRWAVNGDKLYYNTGNVGVGTSNPVSKLDVKSTATSGALFQVINANNDTVFAVYPDGVKVFVNETAKGKVGGFAVSGRSPTKAGIEVEYLRVTPDSTRIYVNDTTSSKGKVGGFAVSGRSPTKGVINDYLHVTKDSTRVYITDINTKGNVGGFAVSGRSPTKAGESSDYFNISGSSSAEIIEPSEARILWYPKKEAFLTGKVLIESPDSIGTNSMATGFESKSIGNYSQALGYVARAKGSNSTAIGNNANAIGNESYAFGNYATSQDIGSYAIGTGAHAKGLRSFAIGSTGVDSSGVATSPTKATGDYSYAFGMGSVATKKGSFAIGTQDTTAGDYSVAMGYQCKSGNWAGTAIGYKTLVTANGGTALGYECTAGAIYSTAIGYRATTATGWWSVAIGERTSATGYTAVSIGRSNTASGNISTAIGYNNTANGPGATTLGANNQSSADYSMALGYFSNAIGNYSIALGSNCTSNSSNSIAIGNGSIASHIDAIAIGSIDTASGNVSLATGRWTKASGIASFSAGDQTKASGQGAFSIGYATHANGFASIAAGSQSIANGSYSFATGYKTTAGTFGTATFGYLSNATASYSISAGYETTSQAFASMVLGRYNVITGNTTNWLVGDPVLVIGNGTGTSARANALTLYKDGNMTIAGILTALSDIRLKTNIQNMDNVLLQINKIKPIYFEFINQETHPSGRQIGFIAQEIQPLFPELVKTDSQGFLSVDYSRISVVLIKAVQEQQNIIKSQETKIQELEVSLLDLNKRLEKLEK